MSKGFLIFCIVLGFIACPIALISSATIGGWFWAIMNAINFVCITNNIRNLNAGRY